MQQAGNPNECSMAPQYIIVRDGHWNRERQFVGCVPRPLRQPPTPAPTDLRGVARPANWATLVDFTLTKGRTEFIPTLPPNIRFLTIENNQIKELPELPDTIRDIKMSNNKIASIPNIPKHCNILEARHNLLDKLPKVLAPHLEKIYLTHNFFEELPSFEKTRLESAGLGFNRLKYVPIFPETLRTLSCQNNNLTEIIYLPGQLRFFNCSNNRDLKTLRIENLRHIETFIAANCGLTEIPILPLAIDQTEEDDENDEEEDNNNNQAGGNGFEPRFIFSGNPLEPEFKRLADDYEDGRISWPRFRKGVLRAHQRKIAAQKQTLGALQQVFKPATGRKTEMTDAERVFANHGPGNIIASFITGKRGTLEAQKLALVANQERYKAVPEGTAARKRAEIADVAVDAPLEGNTEEEKARKTLLQERAKLYVRKQNIAEAAERYKRRMEELEAQKLIDAETAKYLTPLRDATVGLGKEYDNLVSELEHLYEQIQMATSGGLKLIRDRFIPWFPDELGRFIDDLVTNRESELGELGAHFNHLVERTLRNKGLRKLARLLLEKRLVLNQMEEIGKFTDIYTRSPAEYKELVLQNPRFLQDGNDIAKERMDIIHKISDIMFPDQRSDANLAGIRLDDLFGQVRDLIPGLKMPRELQAPIENRGEALVDRGDFPDERLRRGLEMAREAEQQYVDVINNNEENSEAMRILMARAREEAENENEDEEEKVPEDDDDDLNNDAVIEEGMRYLQEQGELDENRHGGRRQNRTPRKRKSQRQSRKH